MAAAKNTAKKKAAAKKPAAKAAAKTAVEAKLAKEQAEALGAGREEAKDRTERTSAKPDNEPGFESPTPSALALEKVGPDGDGEAYQAEKKKHRWG
jgi:hypothetical protein